MRVSAFHESPGGSPLAVTVTGSPSGSETENVRDAATPTSSLFEASGPKTGARFRFATTQSNVAEPTRSASWTITVTVWVPALANESVPVIAPDAGSIARPSGRPEAAKVERVALEVARDDASDTASPSELAWSPGSATDGAAFGAWASSSSIWLR